MKLTDAKFPHIGRMEWFHWGANIRRKRLKI